VRAAQNSQKVKNPQKKAEFLRIRIAFFENIRKKAMVFLDSSGNISERTNSEEVGMAGKLMTKSQLISLVAEKNGLTKATIGGILGTVNDIAIAETKKNGQFVFPGIGKLVKSHRKARMGRNPQTGAAIKIPAKTVVKFRVAKSAKDAIVPPKK
jgi:DNA-binding protein HU-beta